MAQRQDPMPRFASIRDGISTGARERLRSRFYRIVGWSCAMGVMVVSWYFIFRTVASLLSEGG